MNCNRRKQIETIIRALRCLNDDIEHVMDEEQESLDNLPESLQESEKAEKMSECIDYLDDAMGSINECIENLLSAQE